ncbi:DUF2520 domain-containing protein [Candidatus Bipolaricaulota bacterium]|nr:DUF2520 domain-containing protein [Candidatus Bipolaricaulota bacterium]
MTKPTLAFIGAGTLGTALAEACMVAGYRVLSIHSHRFEDAARLANALPQAEAVSNPNEVTNADLTFLTVPDDVIATVCESIAWPASSSVVHCSGALSLDVLNSAAQTGAATGSLHPLQTFAPGAEHAARLSDITYALEASGNELHDTLEELVETLGGRPQWIASADKPLYHASAAMASNYLVALLGDASRLWESFGFSRDSGLQSLLPLVRGTIDNLQGVGFPDALTGPIARGDVDTVRIHLDALTTSQPDIVASYAAMGKQTVMLGLEKGTLSEDAARTMCELLDAAVNPEGKS